MWKGFVDMVPLKNITEQVINTWLSYTMSQPVYFDLAIILVFVLQYTGYYYFRNLNFRIDLPKFVRPQYLLSYLRRG